LRDLPLDQEVKGEIAVWTKPMRDPQDAFSTMAPNPRRAAGLRDLERIVDALVETGLFRTVTPLERPSCGGPARAPARAASPGAAI
jgi:hypothetical protein